MGFSVPGIDSSKELLLIERQDAEVDLLDVARQMPELRVHRKVGLPEGMVHISNARVDVVLLAVFGLDLSGLRALLSAHPSVPVVVLTHDEAVGENALVEGAGDYLRKGQVTADLLRRSLRYAMERHRLLTSRVSGALAPTAPLGKGLLRETSPERFNEVVSSYGGLLALSLEAQVRRVDQNITASLSALANQLGAFSAGPRDVVDVHKVALSLAIRGMNPEMARSLTEEGRFLVLELMGHLVTFYRKHCNRTIEAP